MSLVRLDSLTYFAMPTPTTDFSIFDGQELVTYEPVTDSTVEQRACAAAAAHAIAAAERRADIVMLQATDVVFHLDGTPLAAVIRGGGDTITDVDNSVIYDRAVRRSGKRSIKRLPCRRRPVPGDGLSRVARLSLDRVRLQVAVARR